MVLRGRVLSLSGVTKWLGDRLVLDGVDWEVCLGEHWVVMGLNGSGKTTLLRIASGRLWPSSGEVAVLGRRLGSVDLRMLRRRIGWVSSALMVRIPPGIVSSDVVLSGRFDTVGLFDRPSEADVRKARRLARFMGCGGLLDRPFGVLSQGEQQRILITRALMSDPKLLFLDEPCAGLDLKAREVFLEYVGRLTVSGLTVVYVTHHLEEVIPEFTHVLFLREGCVHSRGLKDQVLNSRNVSAVFDVEADVECRGGRYYVRM